MHAPSDNDYEGAPPVLRERLHSAAGIPLLVQDPVEDQADQAGTHMASRLVGVLGVGSATPYRFAEVDVQLLQRVADRIALAVDHARLYTAEQDARQRAEAALVRAQASEAQAAERAERLHTILETIGEGWYDRRLECRLDVHGAHFLVRNLRHQLARTKSALRASIRIFRRSPTRQVGARCGARPPCRNHHVETVGFALPEATPGTLLLGTWDELLTPRRFQR